MLGVAAVVGIGGGVAYYLYSLSYESTDDAFVDGHVVAVSPRVAGHVAKVYVTDNQWVNQGDLLAELDPRDFEARLAAAEAALAAARAGQKSRSIGADVTEITSTAGVDEASAAVEGAGPPWRRPGPPWQRPRASRRKPRRSWPRSKPV